MILAVFLISILIFSSICVVCANVSWDNEMQTVTIKSAEKLIKLQVSMLEMYVNSEMVWFDVSTQIMGGITLVLLRAVSEGLVTEVRWNNETKTALFSHHHQL